MQFRRGYSLFPPSENTRHIYLILGNLDSLQFLNKSIDSLVSTHTTSKFLKNYIRNINSDPSLLDVCSLGLYNEEIPGETFEISREKAKNHNQKKTDNISSLCKKVHQLKQRFKHDITACVSGR